MLPTLEKTPTTKQLVMYAGASGDFYEVHYDLEFARERGLSNVIVHGALKNAFLAQVLTDWAGAASIEELSVRYAGMDEPGAPLRCMGKVTDKKEEAEGGLASCDIWIENAAGAVTTSGSAVVRLPGRGS